MLLLALATDNAGLICKGWPLLMKYSGYLKMRILMCSFSI